MAPAGRARRWLTLQEAARGEREEDGQAGGAAEFGSSAGSRPRSVAAFRAAGFVARGHPQGSAETRSRTGVGRRRRGGGGAAEKYETDVKFARDCAVAPLHSLFRFRKGAMKLACILTLGVLLTHCATAPKPPPPDLKGESELAGQLKRRDALQATFKQAPGPARQRCELQAGDCRMEVSEGRDKVLRDHSSPQCRGASDSEAELKCVSGELVSAGQASVASEYYRLESWCLQQLVACTAQLADDAVIAAQRAALENRKERIETARSGVAARALVTYAEERVSYLRALLPVPGDAVCSDRAAVPGCEEKARAQLDQFQAELAKDDAGYDEPRAISLYEASHTHWPNVGVPRRSS